MSLEAIIRVFRPDDLDAVIAIDAKVTGSARPGYYRRKLAAGNPDDTQINVWLVAESGGGVVGFVMGTIFYGEFCTPESYASIDSLGVDPDAQDRGVGGALFDQFAANMRAARVGKIYTQVDWRMFGMLKFFGKMGFAPSQRLSLECLVK